MCDGTGGVEPDKGSGGSCGPAYLHGNVPTGSHARAQRTRASHLLRAHSRRERLHAHLCTVDVHVNGFRMCLHTCRPPLPFFPWPYHASAWRHVRMYGDKGPEKRGRERERGLKTTFKNVGYRRAEGSLFSLGTGSDRYFPFRRGIRARRLPFAREAKAAAAYLPRLGACSRLENPIHRRE
jgi:hypothetical protein